jgi:hypothetical protein
MEDLSFKAVLSGDSSRRRAALTERYGQYCGRDSERDDRGDDVNKNLIRANKGSFDMVLARWNATGITRNAKVPARKRTEDKPL